MSILGNEVLRVEDPRMLTQGGIYVADIDAENKAHAVFVRATMAHARLLSVETDGAKAMPGVLDVVTLQDLQDTPGFTFEPTKPMMADPGFARTVLAKDVVRFVGEPIVAILAETVAQANDAAEAVIVDYDPLPVVVSPTDAVEDNVVVWDSIGTNIAVTMPAANTISFDDCETVVSQVVENGRMSACPIEPRVAMAQWGEDGRLVCHSSVQGAHPAQAAICAAIGLEPEQVRVIIPDVGGGFGAKAGPGPEEAVLAVLAKRAGRPAAWAETRTENLLAMGHGRAQTQTVTMGGTTAGDITHYRLEVLQDCGAYAEVGSVLPMFTGMMASGVYEIDNVEYSARSVITNTSPTTAFRGAGRPEASAAIERAVDLFAAEIGMDSAEVRRRNLVASDQFPYSTPGQQTYDSGDYEGALDKALAASDYPSLRAEQQARRDAGATKQLGIGVSVYVEITAPMGTNITEFGSVELMEDGSIMARTGTTPYGQGHVTAWKMIVSDRTGVPMEQIEIIHGDTDEITSSGITGGSKSAQISGSAMSDAALKLVDAARDVAANLLEAAPEDVVLDAEAGAFHVAGTPAVSVDWPAVAEGSAAPLLLVSDFAQAGSTFPFGAHIAVVEVDTETGSVELSRFIACDDAGTILNPLLARGQIHGGIAAGVAQALLEGVSYDEYGNLTTSNFADYTIVSAAELPSFELVSQETPTPMNPLGAKGIGESGSIGATPAAQNAVVDALNHLGIRHIDMPTTPERVWQAITNATSA